MFPNQFSFTISNSSDSAIVVAILAGTLSTLGFTVTQASAAEDDYAVTKIEEHQHNKDALVAYGINVGAILDDGTIATTVTASSGHPTNTIRNMKDYIKSFPQYIRRLSIQASNSAAFSESLVYKRQTPLGDTGAKTIALSKFLSTMQPNEKKIIADFGTHPQDSLILGAETILYTKIPANTDVTYMIDMQPVQ